MNAKDLKIELGGTKPGQLVQTGQRDILYIMVSRSAIEAEEKKQEGCVWTSRVICLPKEPFLISFSFLKVAEHLPANGK